MFDLVAETFVPNAGDTLMTRTSPTHLVFTICACLAICASAPLSAATTEQESASQAAQITEAAEARALHVLNRLTFGPRPGDVERVLHTGIENWINQQLNPKSVMDSAAITALKGCDSWIDPVQTVAARMSGGVTVTAQTGPNGERMMRVFIIGSPLQVIPRDSARRLGTRGSIFLENGQLFACRLARVEYSDRQLLEVMTDFWENHFYVSGFKLPSRGAIIEWDRAVIQPSALGQFRDLLGAVVHSPTMLQYLDNTTNSVSAQYPTLTEYALAQTNGQAPVIGKRTGSNENFARELLELHTLGVDGGYTQADVINVARAFSGWTHSGGTGPGQNAFLGRATNTPITFVFDPTMHDAGEKVVLGRALAAGRGEQDGEDVLDMLARHPSTARFIARKLAVRFVSDNPPESLVGRAAATFLNTDGDIREVVRTIVTSPEFKSPDVYGAKVKSPLEFVLSARRALAAPIDTAAETIDLLIALEQRPFGHLTPEGWPETADGWMNTGAIIARMNVAVQIGQGELPSIPVEAWPAWTALVDQSFDKQVDGVISALLHGKASAELRRALAESRPKSDGLHTPEVRARTLRRMLTLTLGSPDFQYR
jgi:uncharacterized protein (DUF1800 family)